MFYRRNAENYEHLHENHGRKKNAAKFGYINYAGGTEVDLLKADVYSLALCGILTMLPSIDASGMIIDFVQNCSEEEEYIEKMIKKSIYKTDSKNVKFDNREKYSDNHMPLTKSCFVDTSAIWNRGNNKNIICT